VPTQACGYVPLVLSVSTQTAGTRALVARAVTTCGRTELVKWATACVTIPLTMAAEETETAVNLRVRTLVCFLFSIFNIHSFIFISVYLG
jgi:hypothetical protein